MEEHHIHRLVVVADGADADRRPLASATWSIDRWAARVMGELGVHELAAPASKAAGEAKEPTRAAWPARRRCSTSTPTSRTSTAWWPRTGRGVADAELPSDGGVARSVIPPGTAATRDFSGLAPRIPEFVAGRVRRLHDLRQRLPRHRDPRRWRSRNRPSTRRSARSPPASPTPALAERDGANAHFAHTTEVRATCRQRRGLEPALFGIFVDPVHCKGCAECVEVCDALGYDALRMIDKVPDEASGESDRRALRPRPALLPHAAADAARVPQREGARRPDARRARPRLRRRRRLVHRLRRGDRDPDGSSRRHARSTARTRWASSPRPAATRCSAARIRTTRTSCRGRTRCSRTRRPTRWASAPRWDQDGHPERTLWVIGGDGAMYDIGFQSLSRMVASGADIKVLVLDTQVYSNTGGQASTASLRRPGRPSCRPSARPLHGRPERRKELGRILAGTRRRLRGADHARAHQPLLPGGHGGERVSRARRS